MHPSPHQPVHQQYMYINNAKSCRYGGEGGGGIKESTVTNVFSELNDLERSQICYLIFITHPLYAVPNACVRLSNA